MRKATKLVVLKMNKKYLKYFIILTIQNQEAAPDDAGTAIVIKTNMNLFRCTSGRYMLLKYSATCSV